MAIPRVNFDHFGIYVTDLDRMRDFYKRVFGFVESDSGVSSKGGRICFLTRDIRSHHQFVLAEGRPAKLQFNSVNQITVVAECLEDLRRFDAVLKEEPDASNVIYIDHGISWSLYFDDPEGNWVEVTVNSPFYSPQPFREDLDLSKSDRKIVELTERRCRERPGFLSREEWQAQMKKKLQEAVA